MVLSLGLVVLGPLPGEEGTVSAPGWLAGLWLLQVCPQGLGHFLLPALGWPLSLAGVRLAVRQSWRVLPLFRGQRACRRSELLTHISVLPPRHTLPRSWRARGSWRVIFPGEQMCSSEADVHRTMAISSSALACPGVPSLKRGGGRQACHPDLESQVSWWESWAGTGPRRKRGDVYVGVFWWVAPLARVKGVGVGAKRLVGWGQAGENPELGQGCLASGGLVPGGRRALCVHGQGR